VDRRILDWPPFPEPSHSWRWIRVSISSPSDIVADDVQPLFHLRALPAAANGPVRVLSVPAVAAFRELAEVPATANAALSRVSDDRFAAS
jgi:hypothetical protein